MDDRCDVGAVGNQHLEVGSGALVCDSDGDVRNLLSKERVFISSVMKLEEERASARAIRDLGAEPVWFEEFGGRDADPETAYLNCGSVQVPRCLSVSTVLKNDRA